MEDAAAKETTEEQPSAGAVFCPPERRRFVLVAAILASSLGFIDGTVVSIAMPAIRSDLSASLTEVQWVSGAYLLMLSSLLMAGGALADRHGLRKVFSAGIILFVLASCVCALAPDVRLLIAMRILQGIGAAIMVPASLAIIAKAYPPQERGAAIGVWAAASAATSGLGPVAGGLLLAAVGDWGWRLVFAVNLPLGLAALAFLLRVPPDMPEGGRRLDWVGIILVTLSLAAIAVGLSGGPAAFAPIDPALAPLPDWPMTLAGLVLFLGFIVWEDRARQPMMPLRLFADTGFFGANLATFLLYFALSAVFFFLPMTLITAWGLNSAEAALVFLPVTVLVGLMSGPVGRAAGIRGPRLFMAAGSMVCAVAYAGIAATMHLQGFWLVLMPLATVLGIGMGLLVSPLSAAVMIAVPDRETGIASAVNNTVARMAGLVATASLGGLISVVFNAAGGQQTGLAFGRMPEVMPDHVVLSAWQDASNAGFAAVAALCALLSAIAAIVSWWMLGEMSISPAPTDSVQ
jgi:EmrB/QacA subfamily drug resistance transporter